MTQIEAPEFITYQYDYQIDKPNFSLYKFGPFQWGTQKIEYYDNTKNIITVDLNPWEYHKTTMMLLPSVESITETCILNLSSTSVFKYKVLWKNVPKVVAHIKVTIGEENNSDSIDLNFYYRDLKIAKSRWAEIIRNSSNKESRILKSNSDSILIAHQMDPIALADPDLYLLYTKYLKKVKGLHWDHNSELEKWHITWMK